jgi:CRISPR-associated endonuclease/helicase Cas3
MMAKIEIKNSLKSSTDGSYSRRLQVSFDDPLTKPGAGTTRRLPVADSQPENHNAEHELETSDTGLAQSDRSGETHDPLAEDSARRGGEHGVRAGAGEPNHAGSGTRAPDHATRHVETRLGILTYAELAPHLARRVQALEESIEAGEFDASPLDDALLRLFHERICADLTPHLVGWRRHDVTVGSHTPPDFFRVPVLMREFAQDLKARLDFLPEAPDETLLETLAFAEGRFLSIHPFPDFNGRVTRVFLRLLLRRLDLPAVALVPADEDLAPYLAALAAADTRNWQPLTAIWRQRFEQGV